MFYAIYEELDGALFVKFIEIEAKVQSFDFGGAANLSDGLGGEET